MSKAIRKATNVVVVGAQLYREIALSALSIVRDRPVQRSLKGI